MLHTLSAQLPGCLAIDRHSVQLLDLPTCWTDTTAFESFVAQNTLAGLGAAADLYPGAFLDGIYLDDCPDLDTWLAQERERWHERVAHRMESLQQAGRQISLVHPPPLSTIEARSVARTVLASDYIASCLAIFATNCEMDLVRGSGEAYAAQLTVPGIKAAACFADRRLSPRPAQPISMLRYTASTNLQFSRPVLQTFMLA